MIDVNQLLERALLYDFYGELLTEHQKEVYEDFVLNNYSLGEIAQDRGISRQGVYDLVKRCEKTLTGYEEKLHLVERFLETKRLASKLQEHMAHYRDTGMEEDLSRVEQGLRDIVDQL